MRLGAGQRRDGLAHILGGNLANGRAEALSLSFFVLLFGKPVATFPEALGHSFFVLLFGKPVSTFPEAL